MTVYEKVKDLVIGAEISVIKGSHRCVLFYKQPDRKKLKEVGKQIGSEDNSEFYGLTSQLIS
jgi:hypothetical protein